MILNNAIFKRDSFLNARVPKEVKQKFEELAKSKGRSKSEYILALVLKELEQEGIRIQAKADNPKI
jgi:predicted DNA-binding protein